MGIDYLGQFATNERSADRNGNLHSTTAIPDSIVKAIGGKIFLNDDLTNARNYMLFIARQAKRRGSINDVWVVNGVIKIKDLANTIINVREMSNIPDHSALTKEAEDRRKPKRWILDWIVHRPPNPSSI